MHAHLRVPTRLLFATCASTFTCVVVACSSGSSSSPPADATNGDATSTETSADTNGADTTTSDASGEVASDAPGDASAVDTSSDAVDASEAASNDANDAAEMSETSIPDAVAETIADAVVDAPVYPTCPSGTGSFVIDDPFSMQANFTAATREAFTASGLGDPTQWSWSAGTVLLSPTDDATIGTIRVPQPIGVLHFVASVKITFVGATGDISLAGGGLLLRAGALTQHGDIDRFEIRVDRKSGTAALTLQAQYNGMSDPDPITVSLGALASGGSATLNVDTTADGPMHITVPELAADFQVVTPVTIPPPAGLYGLIGRGGIGDQINLGAWTVCAVGD